MDSPRRNTRSSRKTNFSCDHCRLRKLRCDRPTPCANCVSRSIDCIFTPVPKRKPRGATAGKKDGPLHVVSSAASQSQPQQQSPSSLQPSPSSQHAAPDLNGLLAEIHSLKKLAHDLEARVLFAAPPPTGLQNTTSASALIVSPSSSSLAPVAPPAGFDQASKTIARLESVSMSQESGTSHDTIVFKTSRIEDAPSAPTYLMHEGKVTRCVYLPRHQEARLLADMFVSKLSPVIHVLHAPSLPDLIDETYRQVSSQELVKPGHVILLLSIIASTTHVWTMHDGACSIFSSPEEAHSQTSFWLKAAHDLLAAEQSCPPAALETVLGIVHLAYLTFSREGNSLRYRSLISMGLLLSQELGLHRLDDGSEGYTPNTIRAELGRRAWWYMLATDWVTTSRYGGPGKRIYHVSAHQMAVRKPLNTDDADLTDGAPFMDRPNSEPTEMSYFLQRLRLAEVARSIMEPDVPVTPAAASGLHAHAMALDLKLKALIDEVPLFLSLDTYGDRPGPGQSNLFIQAYLLNSLIQTQRCKLHLYALTSGPSDQLPYISSREVCLQAARRIIRAERQLESTGHEFIQTRLRLSVVLHGVFMASIAILMNACATTTAGGRQHQLETTREVAEVLHIIETAKSHSLAAVRLHEALLQLLYRQDGEQQQQHLSSGIFQERTVHKPFTPVQSSSDAQLAQSLEELVDMDGFQWDDLFYTMNPSSFP